MPRRLVASAPRSATRASNIADGDVVDAHAVERHGRHGRDAVGRCDASREVEALRRETEPSGVLIGQNHKGSASVGHEGRGMIVDIGLEHEMTTRVGLEVDFSTKGRLRLGRTSGRYLGGRPDASGIERGADVVEEIEQHGAAEYGGSPQKRLVKRVLCT